MRLFVKKGFTLIETLLVLTVSIAMMGLKFQELKTEQYFNQAKIAGEQIKTVGFALNNYIVSNYSDLSQLKGPSSKALNCTSNICTILPQDLINEGFLSNSFSGKNVYGSTYTIQIRRSGTAPNYVINGLVIANLPWSEGKLIRYDLLGKAMQSAGADSGVVKNNSTVFGYAGVWTEKQIDFPAISSSGQLAYRSGYESGMYSVYLRRDGSLPMTGDLNLNDHNINNAKNINATGLIKTTGNIEGNLIHGNTIKSTGNISAGGTIDAGGEIYAKNGYGDTIAIGGGAYDDDYELRLNSPKPLSVVSPSAKDYTTVFRIFGKGNIRVDQRLGLMGVDPNALPDGWSGGLNTWDVYANGSIGVGRNRSLAAFMTNEGNIYASNNITGETVTSNKRLTANEYVQINGIADVGTACQSNGLQGRGVNGDLLSCINGIWHQVGGDIAGIIKMWGGSVAPNGWLELNGQAFDMAKNKELAKLYPSGRLPDFRGQFIRAWDHGRGLDPDRNRAILSTQGDAIRNISGNIYGMVHYVGSGGDGAFRQHILPNWTAIKSAPPNGGSSTFNTSFDASRQVPTATENRPANITVMYIIKQG